MSESKYVRVEQQQGALVEAQRLNIDSRGW